MYSFPCNYAEINEEHHQILLLNVSQMVCYWCVHMAFGFNLEWSDGYEAAIRKLGAAFVSSWQWKQSSDNFEGCFSVVQL